MLSILRSWFAAGLAAGGVLAVIELAALGDGARDLVLAVVGLSLALGFAIGGALWLPAALLGERAVHPVVAASFRAAPALPSLIHLGRHLFDGARAATLPGAAFGYLWVPAAGFLALVLAQLIGRALIRHGGWPLRIALGVALIAGAGALELADRLMFVSGYPDLHLFLAIAACAAMAVGLGLVVDVRRPRAPEPAAVIAWALAAALVTALVIAALTQGLEQRDSRALVSSASGHTRHLARVVRAAIDGDDDGFSPVLGGGDCDDGDPARNPGAADRAGDGVDQDCDGVDAGGALASTAPGAPGTPAAALASAAEQRAAWRSSPARAALVERTRAMNLLVVSIDALRADAVSPATTPHLLALAARGARFVRAFAPGSGTDLSLGAFATGRLDPWDAVEQTLAEAIAGSGRATHAILPREVLRYAGRTLLTRGLGTLDELAIDREERDVSRASSSAETTARARAALDRLAPPAADREAPPFFLWVHYFDPHEHLQIEASDRALAEVAGRHDLGSRAGKYAALVALTDRALGRLLEELARRGLAERTIVVVFGDHGESLGEDPRLPDNHGKYVYEPLVRVPLVIAAPGTSPRVSDEPVSLLDLAPSLLDLLDLPPLASGWTDARPLAALVAGASSAVAAAPRALPLHDSDQWGVVRWPLKLLVRPADNLVELYDLERDPGEASDLAAARPGDVAALKALHADFPVLDFDRTRKGRALREALARPPARR